MPQKYNVLTYIFSNALDIANALREKLYVVLLLAERLIVAGLIDAAATHVAQIGGRGVDVGRRGQIVSGRGGH